MHDLDPGWALSMPKAEPDPILWKQLGPGKGYVSVNSPIEISVEAKFHWIGLRPPRFFVAFLSEVVEMAVEHITGLVYLELEGKLVGRVRSEDHWHTGYLKVGNEEFTWRRPDYASGVDYYDHKGMILRNVPAWKDSHIKQGFVTRTIVTATAYERNLWPFLAAQAVILPTLRELGRPND